MIAGDAAGLVPLWVFLDEVRRRDPRGVDRVAFEDWARGTGLVAPRPIEAWRDIYRAWVNLGRPEASRTYGEVPAPRDLTRETVCLPAFTN